MLFRIYLEVYTEFIYLGEEDISRMWDVPYVLQYRRYIPAESNELVIVFGPVCSVHEHGTLIEVGIVLYVV